MNLSTAPPLILGLGARIILSRLFNSYASYGATDYVLLGLWQGVLLYYVWMEQPEFAPAIALGLGVRAVLDYLLFRNIVKSSTTLLSVAVGVLIADLLAQVFEDGVLDAERWGRGEFADPLILKRERLVQFKKRTHKRHRSGYEAQSEASRQNNSYRRMTLESDESDITVGLGNIRHRSPLEQEVANLRSRASAADANRRRCREEKKWALSQGNKARAFQLSWQLKRYTALAESFHKEADARIIEGNTFPWIL